MLHGVILMSGGVGLIGNGSGAEWGCLSVLGKFMYWEGECGVCVCVCASVKREGGGEG